MLRCTLLLACLVLPVWAQTPPILQAMRQHDWTTASQLAGDPLGEKLVTFIRLLMPDQAHAQEILTFLQENPDWPDGPVLERRYGEALANEPDETLTVSLCRTHPPGLAEALLHCAEAFTLAGDNARAASAARTAWVTGISQPSDEAAFLARWGHLPTEADQRRRFDHLETSDLPAAARQIARLDPDFSHLAEARLAFRRGDSNALSYLPAVPEAFRADPDLLLAEARFLRRTHADDAALDLWRSAALGAEAAAPVAQRAAFWNERDALARALLAAHQAQDAYTLADDTLLATEQSFDADFLAGWIALRALQKPALAQVHFAAMAGKSRSALTQSRAHYWLARAAAEPGVAHREYAAAAAWPLTYYGQLAARALGESEASLQARILALQDPVATSAQAQAFAQSAFARAAVILVGWDDPRRAADFLLKLVQPPADAAARSLVAQAALREGLPDVAVQTARLAGRDGEVLPQSGWPIPVQPPAGAAPPGLVLGVMRQESSFDAKIVSNAGAHGLMQLMQATAGQLAKANHVADGPLSDPDVNMRLGVLYLDELLARYGGVVPYAVAAYNAGPHRVQGWIDDGVVLDSDAMIDWIEMIPFTETRNYVQRVLENAVVYSAKLRK
jgi:soluble lytic murein transglycosylase